MNDFSQLVQSLFDNQTVNHYIRFIQLSNKEKQDSKHP